VPRFSKYFLTNAIKNRLSQAVFDSRRSDFLITIKKQLSKRWRNYSFQSNAALPSANARTPGHRF
jgi:hypothetical protein